MTALVRRLLKEERVEVQVAVRTGQGGSQSLSMFKDDFREWRKSFWEMPDAVLLCRDSDCRPRADVLKQFEKERRESEAKGCTLLFAVFEPEIERWYLLDEKAFEKACGFRLPGTPPSPECRKRGGRRRKRFSYKKFIRKQAAEKGLRLLHHGAEWADEIVQRTDFSLAAGRDPAFEEFLEEIRDWLGRLKQP